MSKALKTGLFIVLGFVGLFIAVELFVQSMPEVKEVAEFREKFETIQRGDSKAKVLNLLGEAQERASTFRLGQREGFEESYERARTSHATYYLFWFKGIDFVFAVGFNGRDQVVVAESGGT